MFASCGTYKSDTSYSPDGNASIRVNAPNRFGAVFRVSLIEGDKVRELFNKSGDKTFASSEKFVGDGKRQRAVSLRNRRSFRQVESNERC